MGHKNIIELNGKQYDAITGALLGTSRIKATPEKRQQVAHANHYRGRVIDGFIRNQQPQTGAATVATVQPKLATPATATPVRQPIAGKKFDIQRPITARTAQARKIERSQTLMRHVVTKPKVQMKPNIRTTPPAEMMAKPVSDIAIPLEKKLSVTQVNPVRLANAKQIAKSQHVRKFNPAKVIHQPAQAPVPVQKAPTASSYSIPSTHTNTVPKPPAEQKPDIFEAALAHALSHKEPAPKHAAGKASRRHRRLVNAFAGIAAVAVIGGFAAYLSMPAIELRVASMRAGFSAEVPSYQPMGYARAGSIESSEGKVAVSYRSGDSAYTVTQVASNWNSQTLLDHYTDSKGVPDQTVQSNGRIIYLYDNGAAWVNGGVRYEISGNAQLNADDLVALATSM